ncbi:type III-B CRISPR module RAMP protein Cmr1 [Marichromatium bheemlicum]|uniref:Type III-B CRISPR module RAMP protein Cmr1 n=1 Tax=Marichromatium bheemlicum TaxID=365339 RepID=A0ABX1IBK7_9GAMM|nr:type III-B CRISPR module RAMP protein Cmr1 [Marichromatium bheemlicum]NKN34658.1 type III-B CRISPR module RAMP protein Cmr1 [Marichromatium bheemlicum]
MNRRSSPPPCDLDTLKDAWQRGHTSQSSDRALTLKCKLVTPLYGGGVEAGEVDKDLPIRASSIRGQLRFWWRIACGGEDRERSERLFKREQAIWGGIGAEGPVASRVRVQVRRPQTPRPKLIGAQGLKLDYALFPAISDGAELAESGIEFYLTVSFAADLAEPARDEVRMALRWWASFGGVGARTRRGLGAVEVESLVPVDADEVEDAGGRLCLGRQAPDARSGHERAVGLLKCFRQDEGVGRNHGSKKCPGRSCWPEPDAIRQLSGCSSRDHAKPFVDYEPVFPRAAFGLPIVFDFKGRGEPSGFVLEPADLEKEKRERMASPLILRPYRDAQGRWRPAALLLPGWEQALNQSLKFSSSTTDKNRPQPWPADPQDRARLAEQVKPLKATGQTDALRAFMAFFEQEA